VFHTLQLGFGKNKKEIIKGKKKRRKKYKRK
jgi:hypothetical protein